MHARIFVALTMLLSSLSTPARAAEYVVLAWNDLGMHCANNDFQDFAILPPYNTLWVQVVEKGNPPRIVTDGFTVTYRFPDNTTSTNKTNFWQYEQALFGVELANDVGLTGKGLAGTMDQALDHFVAEGIPLTEFPDSSPTTAAPYQLATIQVQETATGAVVAGQTVVAPVSSEMHCDYCHYDGGVEGIATGRVATNILTLHDEENDDDYPSGASTPLMQRRPILCASCHGSNGLGMAGIAGIPNLSRALHSKHAEEVPQTMEGCYYCHPGPSTQCLRGVMGSSKGMDCLDCHGDMEQVAANPTPWLQEPRCDSAACHGGGYAQDQPLYRNSKGHGQVYCAGCHDSPHAIAPSREANDRIKFINLQGRPGTLSTCTTCHTSTPTGLGPHGVTASAMNRTFSPGVLLPLINR